MGIIAAGQITVVDLSDAPVLNTFITASRPTTQTYSKDSRTYKPSYASTPQVLTLKVTKAGSTANIIDSISSLHWFVVDGPIKTEITSKDNSANEYISGSHNEILTTKLDIDLNKGSKRYEVMGIWPDPSTGLDVQFGGYIDLLLTQNGATGPQGPQGDTGNGIANTVITYGLSMSDTTEPATWSSERPALVKGMYLWTRTVIIYTNGSSTTSYQISYIAKDADATAEIDKTKQELLEKLETVRDDSLAAVDEAKQQLVTVRDESLAAAEEAKQNLANVNTKVDNAKAEIDKAKQDLTNVASELNTAKQDLADSVSAVNTKVDNAKEELTQAKQQLTTVADDLSTAKQDFQNAVSAVDTKATNLKSDLAQAKQDLASQAQQLQEQASAQSELTNRVSSVEETANGTKTTVSELSKTVAQNGKDITSVTARTKVVEDDLAGTKTTLSQVKTTADSTSQKTATLETGLNGLSAKFENLKIGSVNLLHNSKTFTGSNITGMSAILNENYQGCAVRYFKNTNPNSNYQDLANFLSCVVPKSEGDYVASFWAKGSGTVSIFFYIGLPVDSFVTSQGVTGNPVDGRATFTLSENWQRYWIKYKLQATTGQQTVAKNLLLRHNNNSVEDETYLAGVQLEEGNIATDYSPNEADIEQKVAEYKQTADQNYASLQTTVQNLDGTVQHNKTVAEQTAAGFKTRIESLETYKNGESERANAYFESAKTETAKQLTAERTAIAKDYVAKSTYTSDVTGIRNELSATTSTANATKTNLANYQASNDRAVANLQTNMQTANGNISSLKTKVEAVPGQITSAVSSVESKIPTEIGAVNLLKNSKSFTGSNIGGSGTILSETYQGCAVRHLKITGEVAVAEFRNCVYPKLGGEYVASFWAKGRGILRVYFHGNSSYLEVAEGLSSEGNVTNSGDGSISFNLTANWKRYWVKYKLKSEPASATSVGKHLLFRTPPNGSENDVYLAGVQLEEGNVVSGYEPAPEDTAEQISSLSSQIQQTADGITLLATKTELNTAKNELQSGINTATNKANAAQNKANSNAQTISTHTTQISALNTGLQAKVSQTDFNTLSGRVTTAENNITAKANELSSKISSVEGKIPTSMGGRNYLRGTSDKYKTYTSSNYLLGYANSGGTWNDMLDPLRGKTVTVRAYIKNDTDFPVRIQLWTNTGGILGNTVAPHSEGWSVKTGKMTADWTSANVAFVQAGNGANNGGTIKAKEAKLEIGNIPTDWSPAPEDTTEQISSLSSELKQTADGITLLATKTELNNAKNDLQSGINTATNKANAAQNTANNNAQTISTHTTQISALNTGLSAKVSQSEFNTLSGRVTTAENNITAKANELSSKITSVESKIPTEIGSSNLLRKTAVNTENLKLFGKSNSTISVVTKDGHQTYKIVVSSNGSGVYFDGNSQYYNLIKDRSYTFSFWVLTNKDKSYSFNSLGHIQAVNNNSDKVGNDQGHQHTTPVYSTNTIKANTWTKVWCTFKATSNSYFKPYFWYLNSGDEIYIYDMMLNEGKVPLSYTPAPEDTESVISSLSSELKQTKDGITLLATKTELNTAKNELQSGINTATNKANAAQSTANSAQSTANSNAQTISTHTTQISALNTGLQAKVSQSDFNTLSGRVTTAENNITAKANELSSKITSVEGKIPTEIGSTNLLRKTAVNTENLKLFGKTDTTVSVVEKDRHQVYKLVVSGSNNAGAYFNGNDNYYNLVKDRNYTFSFWVLTNKDKNFNMNSLGHIQAVNTNSDKVGNDPAHQHNQPIYSTNTIRANTWTKVWCTFKATSNSFFIPYFWYLKAGDEIHIYDMMLNEGKVPLSYTPAPEDTISQISSLSSELKQTKDGITLLATKTELNTAKNELQSGINTATNKANNNAQTISTHTNQISALNTGLSAKVSQSEFNTLSGRVTSAENNITAKANELSSKITSVEGKIPTSIGGRNYLRGTSDKYKTYTSSNYVLGYANSGGTWDDMLIPLRGKTVTVRAYIKNDTDYPVRIQIWSTGGGIYGNLVPAHEEGWSVGTGKMPADWTSANVAFTQPSSTATGGTIKAKEAKLEIGNIPTDWSPAPEDTISQINAVSSELKQTKDGITLLATKTELNTAKSDLQSGINTATNKANAAQNTANSAQSTANSAQNKANSNAQTISTHTTQISALNTGLQAKVSQSDFNTLSGRVTTAENNITAKANELSSKITSVEGKIPTEIGSTNLLRKTAVNTENLNLFGKSNSTISVVTKDGHQTYKIVVSANGSGVYFEGNSQYYNLIKDRSYTFSFWVLTNKDKSYSFNSLGHIQAVNRNGDIVGSDSVHQHTTPVYSTNTIKANTWTKVWCTFKATSNSYFTPYFWYLKAGDEIYIYDMMLNEGNIPLSYTPAPEDTINQISSLSSEFKQTTDAIKASVTSLDKSTVKSSSLTINSDGIVMKAGKSTTDVANAIGSYFAVNQNAINLFSDKINVKGSMIVNGTITGDKIKASSVDVSKISGLDANFIKSKIEYAMIDWLKGKTITAYNDNMTIDLQNGRISFKDGTNAVYRQTPDGIHTGFLHFEAGSLGGIYAAFGATSTRQGINSKSSEFAGIRCYRVSKNGDSHDAKIDKIEVIGDTIQFGHGYGSDGSIGGGFLMHAVGLENDVYSLNRMVKSIESIWRVLNEHARNVGFNLSDRAFAKALTDEYNAWHDVHHI